MTFGRSRESQSYPTSKQTGYLFLLIFILLLAFALRLGPWQQNRFLEDEALYAYWGLQIATGTDAMLDLEPVDKPPLHPYILALSTWLVGHGETAVRIPSLLASVASVALVYALALELYHDFRVALLSALLLTLSPFAILFASTAFTDPLMTTLVLAALLCAARRHLVAAGILSGLAAATKQQALFFLPLVVAVGWLSPLSEIAESTASSRRRSWRVIVASPWLGFALSFAAVITGVIWWDLSREQRPGFLEQSLLSYGGLVPAEPESLGQRAAGWLDLLGDFWASPMYNAIIVGLLAFWLVVGSTSARIPTPQSIDLALLIFVLGFMLLHLLVGFQLWDRYLLGLVSLAALLAARAVVAVGDAARSLAKRRSYTLVLSFVLVLLLVRPALLATQSKLPFGGDHGAYDGIDELAAFMRFKTPPGSVLYHHWLGYHYRFYLHGVPLRQHWYPDLEDLVHDATVYRREPRYIAFPSWRDNGQTIATLAEAGMELEPVIETTRRDGTVSFRLYRLEGP